MDSYKIWLDLKDALEDAVTYRVTGVNSTVKTNSSYVPRTTHIIEWREYPYLIKYIYEFGYSSIPQINIYVIKPIEQNWFDKLISRQREELLLVYENGWLIHGEHEKHLPILIKKLKQKKNDVINEIRQDRIECEQQERLELKNYEKTYRDTIKNITSEFK